MSYYHLSSEPAEIAGALYRPLGKLILSYSPSLPVSTVNDWTLLGDAVQADPAKPTPLDVLRSADLESVEVETATWAGRWLLIGHGTVRTDAGALLSCHYRRDPSFAIASSPGLLGKAPSDFSALREGWPVPPASGHRGVWTLLPSQVLDLESTECHPRPLFSGSLSKSNGKTLSYSDALERLATLYTTAARRVSGENIWIPLTGGMDSRLVLSIAYAAGLRAQTFTFQKPFPHLSRADGDLPPKLSAIAGFRHVRIWGKSPDPERVLRFDRMFPGAAVMPGSARFYYTRSYWDQLGANPVLLTGLCGELGRLYFGKKIPQKASLHQLMSTAPQSEENRLAISEMLSWWQKNPAPIEDAERWYLESRLAGWASNTANQLAVLYPGLRLSFVLNCAAAYATILGMEVAVRRAATHIQDLTALLLPGADKFPYNPPDPIWRKVPRLAERAIGKLVPDWYRKWR